MTKGILILGAVTAVIVYWASQNGANRSPGMGGVSSAQYGGADASIGSNALGAASGTLNSQGDVRGGLGS